MFSRKVERDAQDYASEARETFDDVHGQVRAQARDAVDTAQSTFNDVSANVRDFTVHQPFMALGIAAIAGLLIGRMMGR